MRGSVALVFLGLGAGLGFLLGRGFDVAAGRQPMDAVTLPVAADASLPDRREPAAASSRTSDAQFGDGVVSDAGSSPRRHPTSARRVLGSTASETSATPGLDVKGLLEEVGSALVDGVMSQAGLVSTLVDARLRKGERDRAEAIVRAFSCARASSYSKVAKALRKAREVERAEELLRHGAGVVKKPRLLAEAALKIDPAFSVELIESAEGFASRETPRGSEAAVYAEGLLKAGRTDEARSIIEPLLQHPREWRKVIDILREINPAEAEAYYRSFLQTDRRGVEDLVELLEESDRPLEAVALIREEADLNPESSWAFLKMARSFPEESCLALRRGDADYQRRKLDDLWGTTGDAFLEQGQEARAVDCWVESLRFAIGEPDQWIENIAGHDPDRAAGALGERIADGDVYWGWSAMGDLWLHAKRKDDAIAAWQRALQADPRDPFDCQGKLDQLAKGRRSGYFYSR